MRGFPDIDWINPGMLSLSLHGGLDTAGLFNAFEEVSERNLSGRPLRYLFDFSETGMPVTVEDALDLASFFLELTPSKTAIGLVSDCPLHPGSGESAFRRALRQGGFVVRVFSRRGSAETWLSRFVTSCDDKGLVCGTGCEFALTAACPAAAGTALLPKQ